MNPIATQSILTDWSLWAAVWAGIAVVLSQLAPLRILIRRGRLSAEVLTQMFLQHRFGNASTHAHLIVTNNGGRDVRVRGLSFEFKSRTQSFILPAANYTQSSDSSKSVVFAPFTLKSGDEWAHAVIFWNMLPRHEEIMIRKAVTSLRDDLRAKRAAQPDMSIMVSAEEANVTPFKELFNKKFVWYPDDYEVTLRADTDPPNALKPQTFRVVIFDDDTNLLKQATDEYKYGHSILPGAPQPDGVFVQVAS